MVAFHAVRPNDAFRVTMVGASTSVFPVKDFLLLGWFLAKVNELDLLIKKF